MDYKRLQQVIDTDFKNNWLLKEDYDILCLNILSIKNTKSRNEKKYLLLKFKTLKFCFNFNAVCEVMQKSLVKAIILFKVNPEKELAFEDKLKYIRHAKFIFHSYQLTFLKNILIANYNNGYNTYVSIKAFDNIRERIYLQTTTTMNIEEQNTNAKEIIVIKTNNHKYEAITKIKTAMYNRIKYDNSIINYCEMLENLGRVDTYLRKIDDLEKINKFTYKAIRGITQKQKEFAKNKLIN